MDTRVVAEVDTMLRRNMHLLWFAVCVHKLKVIYTTESDSLSLTLRAPP